MNLILDQIKPEVLAYLAGYIDGDGCISVSKAKTSHINVTLGAYSGDQGVLEELARNLGGKVIPDFSRHSVNRQMYVWHLHGAKAVAACELLLPYLRAKYVQALAATLFQFDFPHGYGVPPWQQAMRASAEKTIRAFNNRKTKLTREGVGATI